MNKQYYELLGVSEDATDEQIEAQYKALKQKYAEEQWQDGAAGTNAAKMLNKLDVAYEEIMTERKEKAQNTDGASAYAEIGEALRANDLTKAQRLLDAFNERGAEWHYLQSVVFYKKSWINESKKQLEIAMKIDPANEKYREAYQKVNARADYQSQNGGATNTNPNMQPVDNQMGNSTCSNCISCCYAYLCVDCLFSMCFGCR